MLFLGLDLTEITTMRIEDIANQLEATPGEVASFLSASGISVKDGVAEDVTPEMIGIIGEDMRRVGSTAISPTGNSNKPAKSKSGVVSTPRKSRKAATPQPSPIMARTYDELKGFREGILEVSGQIANQESDELMDIIQDIPNQTIKQLLEKAEAADYDPDHFRQRGRDFASAIVASRVTA